MDPGRCTADEESIVGWAVLVTLSPKLVTDTVKSGFTACWSATCVLLRIMNDYGLTQVTFMLLRTRAHTMTSTDVSLRTR